jgi:copper chaperone CopZ
MSDMDTQKVLLRVRGMTCTGCEERIGKVLSRLDGVYETSADHRSGEVRINFAPELVAPQTLTERIEQAGYQVTSREEVTR